MSLWDQAHQTTTVSNIIPVCKAQFIIQLTVLVINESKNNAFRKNFKGIKLSGLLQSTVAFLYSWVANVFRGKTYQKRWHSHSAVEVWF